MRVRPGLIVATLALVLAAACGGSGDDDPASSNSGGPTTSAAPGPVAPDEVPPEPSAGCDAEAAVEPGEEDVPFTAGGVDRFYVRHVPEAHDGQTPLPLVVDFHGFIEGAHIHVLMSALGPFGDDKRFVTISPDSGRQPARWNFAFGSDDLEFVGDLLDEVETALCVDTNRVYVAGLSNGAFMTSAIACEYADRVAAVGPVAGIADYEDCEPDRPVPVVTFHGTDDPLVPYDATAITDLRSVPDITVAWAERNGCDPTPTDEEVADHVTLTSFDCPPGAEVELYTVVDGGHTWPGSEFSASIGQPTAAINATELMWEFFRAHPLPPS